MCTEVVLKCCTLLIPPFSLGITLHAVILSFQLLLLRSSAISEWTMPWREMIRSALTALLRVHFFLSQGGFVWACSRNIGIAAIMSKTLHFEFKITNQDHLTIGPFQNSPLSLNMRRKKLAGSGNKIESRTECWLRSANRTPAFSALMAVSDWS